MATLVEPGWLDTVINCHWGSAVGTDCYVCGYFAAYGGSHIRIGVREKRATVISTGVLFGAKSNTQDIPPGSSLQSSESVLDQGFSGTAILADFTNTGAEATLATGNSPDNPLAGAGTIQDAEGNTFTVTINSNDRYGSGTQWRDTGGFSQCSDYVSSTYKNKQDWWISVTDNKGNEVLHIPCGTTNFGDQFLEQVGNGKCTVVTGGPLNHVEPRGMLSMSSSI